MKLGELIRKNQREGRKVFVAYVTAGDPNLAATDRFVSAIEAAGADILELGIPHSDPVADGPTNLAAAGRGVASGTSLRGVLAMVKAARKRGAKIPIIIFTYFNPILRMGVEAFTSLAADSGVDGVLVVDLPPEEAKDYAKGLQARGIETIFLASPTTDPARLPAIREVGSGFLYYVSRTGVTGAKSNLSETLGSELAALRGKIDLPIYVGFGISTPEHVATVSKIADGVIVGSALVKLIEESKSAEEAEKRLKAEVTRLVAPLKKES